MINIYIFISEEKSLPNFVIILTILKSFIFKANKIIEIVSGVLNRYRALLFNTLELTKKIFL